MRKTGNARWLINHRVAMFSPGYKIIQRMFVSTLNVTVQTGSCCGLNMFNINHEIKEKEKFDSSGNVLLPLCFTPSMMGNEVLDHND